jgi:uncharacterized protein (DUF1501 family)
MKSNHSPSRRDFLRTAGLTAGFTLCPSSLALSRSSFSWTKKKPGSLVCIYLRGGADFLNMIVPYRDDAYHSARPTIGLRKEDGVVELDSKFGLHPGLSAWESLWKSKKLAPVVMVGSPHTTRSHFDAQDFMEFAAPGDRSVRTGWLNRYLAATQKKGASEFRAMALQKLLPRSLRGNYPVLAVPSSMEKKRGAKTLSRFEEFYGVGGGVMEGDESMMDRDGDVVVKSGKVTIETLRRYQDLLEKGKSSVKYPGGNFGKKLQSIAKVLKSGSGLEIVGLDYGGWDDHAGQGGVEGNHHTRLADLGNSLKLFCDDLGSVLDTTTILVMTEFGRTFRENGNSGTDHGHGGGMFVLGGGVRGGRIHGKWRSLTSDGLYQGRDLAVTTDFRDVLAEVLRGSLGFEPPKGFFPNYSPGHLNLY